MRFYDLNHHIEEMLNKEEKVFMKDNQVLTKLSLSMLNENSTNINIFYFISEIKCICSYDSLKN
jgi:hypothetical protein